MTKAVIIACGSEPRLLNIPGEKRLQGSGDQAIEEGMYITKFAHKVTVIVLHDEGVLDCNKVSAERAFKKMATKKNLAQKYGIEKVPFVVAPMGPADELQKYLNPV